MRPFTLFLTSCLLAVSSIAVFYTGYRIASQQSVEIVNAAREHTRSVWQSDIDKQGKALQSLKMTTENSVNAMAGRLSMLQGYVMRLDARSFRLPKIVVMIFRNIFSSACSGSYPTRLYPAQAGINGVSPVSFQ